VEARLSVEGSDGAARLEELAGWLRDEKELRGRITWAGTSVGGSLGTVDDVLVASLGSSGAVAALITAVQAYLSAARGGKISIRLKGPDGREATVSAENVKDIDPLFRQALGLTSAFLGAAPVSQAQRPVSGPPATEPSDDEP
jgi:hypothetical protein